MDSEATGTGSVGLRERKKQATRRALQEVALRQALDRGVEHITVEGICAAVDVSPRTFFNYFSSKEEALAGDALVHAEKLAALIRETDPDGDLIDGLRKLSAVAAEAITERRTEIMLRRKLLEQNPELLVRHMTSFAAAERMVAEAIADRTGLDTARHMYPQLTAAVAASAMRVAIRRWSEDDCAEPLERYVDEAFELVKKGL